MRIDQRNAGASVSVTNTNPYTIDRWQAIGQSSDGVYSVQQDSSAPVGFNYSAKITITTADASIGATQQYLFRQLIEGYNVADLNWGTANAKTVTLSFWVRSSVTGTFGASIRNAAVNRAYPFTYSISDADTWEQKTVTITGDTTGTWEKTTSTGLEVVFSLGSGADRLDTAGAWVAANRTGVTGQTNLIATNGATWYITGVQLEAGSVATSFERRHYGQELALCQRYFEKVGFGDGSSRYPTLVGYLNATNQQATVGVSFVVPKRAIPTIVKGTDSVSNCTTAIDGSSIQGFRYLITASSAGQFTANFVNDGVTASSEL